MLELDPVVLFAVGTAVVGIATVALCVMTAPPATVKEKTTTAPKPKKKSKSSKKSSAGKSGYSSHGQSSADERPKPTIASSKKEKQTAPNPPPEPVETSSTTPVDDDDQDDDDDDAMAQLAKNVSVDEVAKRAKKSKETAEQKAARLQRQKAAKAAKKSETVEGTVAPSTSATANTPHSAAAADDFGATPGDAASAPTFDGWAVVEDKRKVKTKKDAGDGEDAAESPDTPSDHADAAASVGPAAGDSGAESASTSAATAAAPPPPVVDSVTTQVTVESRKLGLLIGPKGVTKIGMQTATGTEIIMPKVEKDFNGPTEISVTGPAEGVARAVDAINELCVKGYCNLLAADDFHEGYVAVHPRHLPDIIGKGGACIKAIQAHTGVKISTPTGYTKTTPSGETIVPAKVKINLAGSRDKVSLARQLILDLTKYYHTPITHPGITHTEMDIPSNYYNYIIGSKGSEIKHIQSNYKVTVYIPSAESSNQNVLIVGEESNVGLAEKHIRKIMEKADTIAAERAAAQAAGIALGESAKAKIAAQQAAAAAGGGGGSSSRERNNAGRGGGGGAISLGGGGGDANARPPRAEKEEPEEEWVAEFAPRSNKMQMDLGSALPATAKFAATPPPPAAAAPVPDLPPGGETSIASGSGSASANGATSNTDGKPATGATTSAWGGMGALPADRWG